MSSFHALLGRQSGAATISRTQVDFVSDDLQQRFSIPLGSLQLQVQGLNSVHFYLSHKAYPGKEICLQDFAAIELLASYGFEPAMTNLKKVKKTALIKTATWTSPIVIGLVSLFLIPLLMSFVPLGWVNKFVSIEQEKALGNLVWPKFLAKEEVLESTKEKIALQKILDALVAANPELKPFKVQIHISNDQEVNAFALPGGRIVINKGLIQKANPEEILGVMAHELAHVERRHILKSASSSLGSLVGYIIIATVAGADAAGVLISVTNFTSLTFSRADEAEADRRGLEFIQNAGFSADGMVSFFEKLAAESNILEKSLTFLSTHPASDDRAATLKELIKKKRPEKEIPVTSQDFSF